MDGSTPGSVAQSASPLVARLDDGPVDVVGDVHGEIDALKSLLDVLGYGPDGEHPDGRRLVFVGDLGDRGPDSPSVYASVGRLIDQGVASCVLGNHELNLLRGVRKDGNGWFFADDHDDRAGRYGDYRRASSAEREQIVRMIRGLPLALERADLRVTHAAWDAEAIAAVRAAGDADLLRLYERHELDACEWLETSGFQRQAAAERTVFGHCLRDPAARLPFLEGIAQADLHYQMRNPVRVLTSGVERLAHRPYYLAGQWRMVERVPWWNSYSDPVPVLVGHYWRAPTATLRSAYAQHSQSLFADSQPHDWLGADRRVFCVDFSVGGRYAERRRGAQSSFATRLGALRWPERELVFDDGVASGLS